jgi:5'-deoxynucleotidase YfbR-like HD superfamily hydrolase
MSWILTNSGRQLNLLNPTAAMVTPHDIAHALSQLCRFNGHTRTHYSVAQHSMIVCNLVPKRDQLPALLHDATEAYLGDMTRPLKALLPEYREIEQRVWYAICERFNIDPILPESVIRADLVVLATERRDLMPFHPDNWDCLKGVPARPALITPMPAQQASIQYFSRLMELMQGDHRRRMSA